MLFRGRAPVRIDLAGGWTDVATYCRKTPGRVINISINIYSYATLIPVSGTGNKIEIESADYDAHYEAEDIKKIEYDGNVDLVKAAIKKFSGKGGFKILSQSYAPAGSGLGTSAAMGVVLVGLIASYGGLPLLPFEIAEAASKIEKEELNILGGKQDHYASALGGINYCEFRSENVTASPLRFREEIQLELEKNLILCYTGKSRLSGNIHSEVKKQFESGNKSTVEAIENLKQITLNMKNALIKGNLPSFAELMLLTWEMQKRLHPSVTNDEIDDIFNDALKNGAIGGKACGAGGGGCLIFYSHPEKEHVLRKILENRNLKIIDFNFDFDGYKNWTV